MSRRPEYIRLRRLLDQTLKPFSDIAGDFLTEEIEKELLITLSQVFRQVKQWTYDYDSDEEVLVDDKKCLVTSTSYSDDDRCLAKIIGDLMFLLSVKNRYAQHLTGNILVAISEFLLTLESGWDDFMQLLCLCLELAICNSIRSSSEEGSMKTGCLDYELSTSRSLLELKMKSANWFVVAAIFRVLRNIHKCLKQDFDIKNTKAYLDFVSSLILKLPWDLLREIYVGHNIEAHGVSAKDVFQQNEIVTLKEITAFFGNFIQFLCSLVSQSSLQDDGDGFRPVIFKIINLVPKLTAWCHTELRSPHHVRISHYFRHKVLMLMVKLSSSIHIEQTIHLTWMDLVHKYFEDLLMQPISECKFNDDDFGEDSPFCTSIFDPGKQHVISQHLQRLSVFLFLKCTLSLVTVKRSLDELQCPNENLKQNCSADPNLDPECRGESIGLKKLHEWLQAHVPADIFANDELYFDRCVRFTLSFLRLFMHEDDILFKMLLLLFHVPFYLERRIIKDGPQAVQVKNPLVSLASDLFNPIHLFHLFLAEIHYDHQVLLDYLISKDTGSSCAEYLLRSLRIICNSWSLFVEFPGVEEVLGQLYSKKQIFFVDCTDNTEHNESYAHSEKGWKNYRLPFEAAKDCLVSLKTSIESLNRKNLFPYNPQVLLKRLTRFQELCIKQ